MSDINIDTSAQTVDNEKTKKQEEALQKAKEAKEAAQKEAEKERIKNAMKDEIKEQISKEDSSSKDKDSKNSSSAALAAGGASLVGALIDVAKDGIKGSGSSKKISGGKGKFWLGAIVGLIVGAGIMLLVGILSKGMIFGTNQTTLTTADEVLQTGMLGYTAVDFQNAVLGEASQHQELIVMEQPLEIATTITKAGLGNLQIFSKVKTITYYGTGVYTIDMSKIDADHIQVDMENKQVTILIPHSCLQYVNPDLDKTEFEDTEKGLLAFGDIKLKTEDQNRLMQAVYQSMEDRLKDEELFKMADEYASMSSWQMFQPLISAVSPEFTVEIGFDEATSNQVTAHQD